MDENKLKVLNNINYQVKKVCRNCAFSQFNNDNEFGGCFFHDYDHKKHTATGRLLSITQSGYCNDHELEDDYVVQIHAYNQFLEK